MTFEEAQKYRRLLDRKKKALALTEEQQKKYKAEIDKIIKETTDKHWDYLYYVVRWGQTKEENEKALIIVGLWEQFYYRLCRYEEQGEGEKIDKIINGLKLIYEAL